MQMRFDGYLGFPGGLIDPGENPEFSLNREMEEEMCLDLTKHSIQACNHVISHYSKKTGLLCHFYALEVTTEELRDIELRALGAKDHGIEVCVILLISNRCTLCLMHQLETEIFPLI